MPWYSRKKGEVVEQYQNKYNSKYYKNIDDVIEGARSDSKITKEIIGVAKR